MESRLEIYELPRARWDELTLGEQWELSLLVNHLASFHGDHRSEIKKQIIRASQLHPRFP